MEPLLDLIVKNVFDAVYIICWVLFVEYILQTKPYKANICPLEKQLKELSKKQAVLIETCKILKSFILHSHSKTEYQIKKIKERLESQKREKPFIRYDETNISDGGITFPHYRIYDKGITNIDDLKTQKCPSIQLSKFLSWEEGKTSSYENIEYCMKLYFNLNSKEGLLVLEPRIRNLLNISREDNPKITWDELMRLVGAHIK